MGQQPWPVPESSTQFLLITPRTLDSLTEGSKLEFCQNLSLSPAICRPGSNVVLHTDQHPMQPWGPSALVIS